MYRRLLTFAGLCTVLGCTSQAPAGQPPSTPLTPQGEALRAIATADTVPFARWPEVGAMLQRGTSEQLVLESQADLDAFLDRHPAALPLPVPSNYPSPHPEPKPYPVREQVGKPDFGKYRGILVFVGDAIVGDVVKVVRIEEQADKFVVHANHWTRGVAEDGRPQVPPAMDLVGLPRTAKPIVFAPLQRVTLKTPPVQGSPRPGAAASQVPPPEGPEQPTWKAVPNPEVTRASIETELRAALTGSRIDALTIERRTFTEVRAALPGMGTSTWSFTPDSDVWHVVIEGDLAASSSLGAGGAEGRRAGKIVMLRSIEDGHMLKAVSY